MLDVGGKRVNVQVVATELAYWFKWLLGFLGSAGFAFLRTRFV
jgi:hypothetical protein